MHVICSDSRFAMSTIESDSIGAIVTDPPYELNFMGRGWDRSGVAFDPETWGQAFRILVPGGHLIAFGGTRTHHRMAVAIEDAGFEIRDSISWIYGSGFPKSLDISKSIDKAAGAEREVIGPRSTFRPVAESLRDDSAWHDRSDGMRTEPATPNAIRWAGWGTALKPSHETITLARKPLIGTVAANVTTHGAGGINVDACRVGTATADDYGRSPAKADGTRSISRTTDFLDGLSEGPPAASDLGRWAANVVLTHSPECSADGCHPSCPVAELDRQSGELRAGERPGKRSGLGYGSSSKGTTSKRATLDSGGASRYFPTFAWDQSDWFAFHYFAKASKRERNAGLENTAPSKSGVMQDDNYKWKYDGKGNKINLDTHNANSHPTVKPLQLCRWLVRLVCSPHLPMLDPFAGSGSILVAAKIEGIDARGIEGDTQWLPVIAARIKAADRPEPPPSAAVPRRRKPRRDDTPSLPFGDD